VVTPPTKDTLARLCPDLAEWPRTWQIGKDDLAAGQRIVEALTPFVHHLVSQGLAARTFARHRDNIWLLGGELIRRRHTDDDLRRQPVAAALQQLVEGGGGPLIGPGITESEQESFDVTCRKFYRFLVRRKLE
jgi:hypothetical protein